MAGEFCTKKNDVGSLCIMAAGHYGACVFSAVKPSRDAASTMRCAPFAGPVRERLGDLEAVLDTQTAPLAACTTATARRGAPEWGRLGLGTVGVFVLVVHPDDVERLPEGLRRRVGSAVPPAPCWQCDAPLGTTEACTTCAAKRREAAP